MKERLDGIGRRSLRTVSQIIPPRTLYFTLPWPSRNLPQSLPQWFLFRTSNSLSERFYPLRVDRPHQRTGIRPSTERADLPRDVADAIAQGEEAYKIGFSGRQRFARANLTCRDSYEPSSRIRMHVASTGASSTRGALRAAVLGALTANATGFPAARAPSTVPRRGSPGPEGSTLANLSGGAMLRALLVPIITIALLSGSPVCAKGDGNGDKDGGNAGSGGRGSEDGGAASHGNGRSAGEGEGRGNDAGGGGSHANGNSGKSGGVGPEGGSALGGRDSESSSRSGGRQSDRSSGGQLGGDLGGEGRAAGSQSTGNSSLGGRSSSISGRSDPAPASPSASTTDRLGTIGPPTMSTDTVATNTVLTAAPLNIGESNNEPTLPLSLAPRFDTRNFTQTGVQGPILPRGSIPVQIVGMCRNSIIRAAVPYGAVRVDAASAGQLNRTRGGGLVAPIEVRVAYTRATAHQIRQSRISCRLNAAGAVVGLRG